MAILRSEVEWKGDPEYKEEDGDFEKSVEDMIIKTVKESRVTQTG